MNKKRFYIHCGDDINRELMDTESDFTIHIAEICFDEDLIKLCNLLNEQQATIDYLKEENEQLRKLIDWSEINIADLIGDGV